MDEQTYRVEITRLELRSLIRTLAKRAADSGSKSTRRYLFNAAATLDGILMRSSGDPVAVEGRLGWLRIIGLTTRECVTEDAG